MMQVRGRASAAPADAQDITDTSPLGGDGRDVKLEDIDDPVPLRQFTSSFDDEADPPQRCSRCSSCMYACVSYKCNLYLSIFVCYCLCFCPNTALRELVKARMARRGGLSTYCVPNIYFSHLFCSGFRFAQILCAIVAARWCFDIDR